MFDPVDTGHHPRYRRAIMAAVPDGVRIELMRAGDAFARHGRSNGRLATLRDAWDWSGRTVALARRFDVVLVGVSGTALQSFTGLRMLFSPKGAADVRRTPVAFVDTHGQVARLKGEATNRRSEEGGRKFGSLVRYFVVRALRECAVRCGNLVTLHSYPSSADIGSERLRRRATVIGDPLDVRPSIQWRPSREPRVVLLIGTLSFRKGIDLALEAWEALPAASRRGWQLRLAGEPTDEMSRRLLDRYREVDGIAITARRLSDREYSTELSRASVIVTVYRNHATGSGVLAALDGWYRGEVIASSHGVVGDIARSNGRRTTDTTMSALAIVLGEVLTVTPSAKAVMRVARWHPTPAAFGRAVWSGLGISGTSE